MTEIDPKHTCRRCGKLGVILKTDTIHQGGKVVCPNCLSNAGEPLFIAWQAKDKIANDKKRKTDGDLIKKYSKGFCEMCLVAKNDLPPARTLEVHHVIPVKEGGGDERDNLQILCTGCHKLIHWMRTYK